MFSRLSASLAIAATLAAASLSALPVLAQETGTGNATDTINPY